MICIAKRKLGKGLYVEENTFGGKLRKERISNNLTQEELAIALGVTKSVISNWERSLYNPSKEHLSTLQSILPNI